MIGHLVSDMVADFVVDKCYVLTVRNWWFLWSWTELPHPQQWDISRFSVCVCVWRWMYDYKCKCVCMCVFAWVCVRFHIYIYISMCITLYEIQKWHHFRDVVPGEIWLAIPTLLLLTSEKLIHTKNWIKNIAPFFTKNTKFMKKVPTYSPDFM